MKILIYSKTEDQSENSDEICRDIVTGIFDKVFEQEESVKDVKPSISKRKLIDD